MSDIEYDLDHLSPKQFEEVCAALVGKELGVYFETFAEGKDDGIDARYTTPEGCVWIIQCKHYVGSSLSHLYRSLKKEVDKAKKKKSFPARYIICTSCRLRPNSEAEFKSIFSSYVKIHSHDIWGKDKILAKLREYEDVIFSYSDYFRYCSQGGDKRENGGAFYRYKENAIPLLKNAEALKEIFVKNKSFNGVQQRLKDQRMLVVTGEAGIGKTTLSQVLCLDYQQRGYNILVLDSHDFSDDDFNDIFSLCYAEKNVLVFCDDFLGMTSLEISLSHKRLKNIAKLVKFCRHYEGFLFLLTSRTYILNKALEEYGILKDNDFNKQDYRLDVTHYNDRSKAYILFNHLRCSGLERSYLEAFVHSSIYHKIIEHPCYNPRIIKDMTVRLAVEDTTPSLYPSCFLEALNDPFKVWEAPFKGLSHKGRAVLYTVFSFAGEVSEKKARECFLSIYPLVCPKYEYERDRKNGHAFNDAVKELAGDFIKLEEDNIKVSSPAIQDFLIKHFKSSMGEVKKLYKGACYWEQIATMWDVNKDEDAAIEALQYLQIQKIKEIKSKEGVELYYDKTDNLYKLFSFYFRAYKDSKRIEFITLMEEIFIPYEEEDHFLNVVDLNIEDWIFLAVTLYEESGFVDATSIYIVVHSLLKSLDLQF